MKKVLILLLLIILTSCDIETHSLLSLSENPFSDIKTISTKSQTDDLYFLVLTDAHYNRETRDSNVYRNEENLFKFLDNNQNIDAILFLGDMIDEALDEDVALLNDFIEKLKTHLDKEIIYIPGNHEANKGSSVKEWEEAFGEKANGAFKVGDTTLYKLNSTYRILGRDQLDYLEESIKNDDSKYKILLSHIPLSIKGFNQGLFEFVLSDVNEINRILKIMDGERGLYLSGHHHMGKSFSSLSSSFKEYIFPSFHRKDTALNLESKGYYHILKLNQESGEVTITSFLIENENPDINSPDSALSFSI